MPPAVVGTVSHLNTGNSESTLTMAHTSTGDPLYVCASISDPAESYGTITYAGMPLERIGRVTGSSFSQEWWFLHNPPAGTANVVVTLLSGSDWLSISARNVSGGDLDLYAKNLTSAAATSTAPSVTLASAVGDLVLDFLSQNANSQVFTPGAGQTADWAQSLTGNNHYTAGSKEDGAASVTMSYGLSISTPWLYSAISIPAAGTAGPVETRVTQDAVEVLSQPALPEVRVTQDAIELLSQPTSNARISQYAVEILRGAVAQVWITQATVEIITIPPIVARVSQLAVEVLNFPIAEARLSQVAVEVLLRLPPDPSDLIGPWMGDGMASGIWIE